MLAAARMAARPARFPGTQAAPTNTAGGTSSRTRNESSFNVLPLFFCVFPIYDTLSSTAGIIRQATVEGQNGALNRPTVSPGEVSGIETAGAAIWRITARASGSGGAALRPCVSSRVIFIPVTQTRLTAVQQPPGRFSASARPHLTVQRPVATAAEVIIGGGEQGGGRPPRPRSHAASP